MSKPYYRRPSFSNVPLPNSMLEMPPDHPSHIREPVGFPTLAEYKRVEAAFVSSLHPTKREKALISQEMFDNIWDILQDPNSREQTPQFRWWVRKMFTLSTNTVSSGSWQSSMAEPPVVLHENRPLATVGQLYQLLCYCHARADHGGRDRTLVIVRQHYSWVPKRLVAAFVAICPTCNGTLGKKRRRSSSVTAPRSTAVLHEPISTRPVPANWEVGRRSQSLTPPSEPLLPTDSHTKSLTFPTSVALSSQSHISTLHTTQCSETTFLETTGAYQSSHQPIIGYDVLSPERSLSSYFPSSFSKYPDSIVSHPMSRDVSLFSGLSNGMQYTEEYCDAQQHYSYTDFNTPSAKSRRAGISNVIFPQLQRSDVTPKPSRGQSKGMETFPGSMSLKLPPLMNALPGNIPEGGADLQKRRASLPESLRTLRLNGPQNDKFDGKVMRSGGIMDVHSFCREPLVMTQAYGSQIDPSLLLCKDHADIADCTPSSFPFTNDGLSLSPTKCCPEASEVGCFFDITCRPIPTDKPFSLLTETVVPCSAGGTWSGAESANLQLSAFPMSATTT
jgi:hypothetical protein